MAAERCLWGEQARLKVTEQNFEEPGFTCDERLWVTKVMPGGLAEAAGLDASSGTALRRTRETGVVVQRESLKRLSAMLSDRRTRNKQRMGAKKMSRLHKKRSKASAAAMSDDDTVSGPDSPLQRSPAGKATRMQSRRDVLAMAES